VTITCFRFIGLTLALTWLGLTLLASIAVASPDLAPTRSANQLSVLYCPDVNSQLPLESAKSCDYLPYRDLRLSFKQGRVMWVKVTDQANELSANQPPNNSVVLPINIFVAPHLIKRIEIFDGQTNQLIAGPVGTAYPFAQEHGLLGGYSFTVRPDSGQTNTYYIRVVASGLPYAIVQASLLNQATAEGWSQQLGLGIHLGVLGFLFLASALGWIVTRDRMTGCFALVILNLLLGTLAGSGFLFQYAWPNWPAFNEFFFSAMMYLRVALWVLLAQAFLAPYQTPAWYRRGCMAAYLVVGVMLLLLFFEKNTISNWLLLIFGVTLIPALQVVAIHQTQGIRTFYQRLLIAAYASGALLIWATLLVTLLPTNDPRLPIQFARLVDYVNPLVLLALVLFHYRETASQLVEAKKENMAIRLGLEFEQKRREERKLMVDMLTHELKNPLASISLAIGSLGKAFTKEQTQVNRRLENIDRCVRSMDAVIERCNFVNQLDQRGLDCTPTRIGLHEVMTNTIERFAESPRVSLTIDGRDEFVTDPQLFQIIVSNLIENALKYSPAATTVNIAITNPANKPGAPLLIKISNAIGTKGAPDKEMVFSRFYRNPLALGISGSGVGLYLVQQLVRIHGGVIRYEPTDSQVVFSVELQEVHANANS